VHLTVDAAAGIAAGPVSGGLPELLRRADAAMYQAKQQGALVCAYRPEREIDAGLTMAGQVAVTFRPVVNLATTMVTGAHALANWHDRRRHRINPHRLALEHPTALSAYSRHVLDRTLFAVASWRAAGFDLPASVHVTARSLLEPDFGADLGERLNRVDVPADRLTIEVSATLLHANFSAANTTIKTLANMGVRLGLTDFGAGATSLASLAQMPIHQLTVAPQLVAQIEKPAVAAIVRSILDLGRNLDVAVGIDGIETELQRSILRDLGCVTGQGPLFAEPMSPERLLTLLRGIPRQRQPLRIAGKVD
jgi:diguanylate cyclase